jgi:Type ISP C-terminal specificity domain/N-6 DNA Methylase
MPVGIAEPDGYGSNRLQAMLANAIADFGSAVREKLADHDAEREEQLRAPLESLLRSAGRALGLRIVPHGEVRLADLRARPDFAIDVAGARVGYIELKRPTKGVPLTPSWKPTKDDTKQWEKLKALPNLIYSDGNHWALYRYGHLSGKVALLNGDISRAGSKLRPVDDTFAQLLHKFLLWKPEAPRTLHQLVNTVAGLCRLLNDEVSEILSMERQNIRNIKLFEPLAADWRRLLYPDLTDVEFANAYAQTVTFALLLARVDGISFEGISTAKIAKQLRKRHPLMGRALEVLTDQTTERGGIIETLTRIISVVDWDRYARQDTDPYALLYEKFLEIYDPELRKRTGTYYTPKDVVRFMVRFVDQILRTRLSYPLGLAADNVIVLDPAMGTGTYLAETINAAAQSIAADEGLGAVPARLRMMCDRLIGFEIQAGPYAIAELRIYSELKSHDADPPDHMRLCVTDTLDSPYKEEELGLGHLYEEIARSRNDANYVKREVPVLVIIGNPPYGEHAKEHGKWVLERSGATKQALLDDFRMPGPRNLGYNLHDKYVYFWRWAIWKVFEAHPDHPAGVIAFISPSSFIKGPGFAKMRDHLRRVADEGWIIDLTPENHQSDVPFRVFPDNQNPVSISIFSRSGKADLAKPADIHYLTVPGLRDDKFHILDSLQPDSKDLVDCSPSWQDPFHPPLPAHWRRHPALRSLLLWSDAGIKPGRTWVYADRAEILRRRVDRFTSAPENEQAMLFGPRPRSVSVVQYRARVLRAAASLMSDNAPLAIERVAYRSFDRKYLLADESLVDRLRSDLWQACGSNQVFITEQHTAPIKGGPGLLFSALVPDNHHFMGNHGGRVFPLYRDADGRIPNFPPQLLALLTKQLCTSVTEGDLLAYIACVVANTRYTEHFQDELQKFRGIRVPLTSDSTLWANAVELGRTALWLHTYGDRYVDVNAGRPAGPPRLSLERPPRVRPPGIPNSPDGMPERISYGASSQSLWIGSGEIQPVSQAVWDYEVAGTRVIERWFRSRKRAPRGRRSSDLDDIRDNWWRPEMTTDLLELLNVLGLVVELDSRQADLFETICAGSFISTDELSKGGALVAPGNVHRPHSAEVQPSLGITLA